MVLRAVLLGEQMFRIPRSTHEDADADTGPAASAPPTSTATAWEEVMQSSQVLAVVPVHRVAEVESLNARRVTRRLRWKLTRPN